MMGEEYGQILDQLVEKHQPFNVTSSSWVGCLGSDQKFRGYPCSLWQTFHSLTVGALLADELEMNGGGVSKTIVDYVHYFFTCRHCAEHFATEVERNKVQSNANVTFPLWPSDTVFWMWKLHNMANLRLKGTLTRRLNIHLKDKKIYIFSNHYLYSITFLRFYATIFVC